MLQNQYDLRDSSPVISNQNRSKRVLEPLQNKPAPPIMNGMISEDATTNPAYEGGVTS